MSITLEPCRWAHIGGKLLPAERATVPIDSHALHFGSAAFESLRLYRTPLGPRIVGLEQHLDRLVATMKLLRLVPIDRETVRRAMLDVVAANELEDGYLRILAYPGGNCSRLDPTHHTPELLILAWRVIGPRFAEPLTLGVSAIRRPPANTSLPRAKHSGMYGIYAAIHSAARSDGYDDALVLHTDGSVCEVTGANIFLVNDGRLLTPPIPESIDGVTRRLVMRLAEGMGIDVHERPLMLDDFAVAQEIFITGTFHGLRPVSAIDGRAPRFATPGTMTQQLQARYVAMLDAPTTEDAQWTTTLDTAPHRTNGAAATEGLFHVRPADHSDIPQVLEAVRLLLEELRGVPGVPLPAGAETVCTRTIEGRARGAILVAVRRPGASTNGSNTNGSSTNGSNTNGANTNGASTNGTAATPAPDQLIGVLCLNVLEAIHMGGTYALIQDLWVDPTRRSDGVGAALVAAAEAYCRDHRIANIEVCLPSHRFPRLPRTHNFYQSCGFIELGPRMRKEVS